MAPWSGPVFSGAFPKAQLGLKHPASHRGSGQVLWSRTASGLSVESFELSFLLLSARRSRETLLQERAIWLPSSLWHAVSIPFWRKWWASLTWSPCLSWITYSPGVCLYPNTKFFQKMISPVENHMHVNQSRKGSSGWKQWRAPHG